MNGAPFGSLLIFPVLAIFAAGAIAGAAGTLFVSRSLTPAAEARECIVIDMRTKPGPGRVIPAEPEI